MGKVQPFAHRIQSAPSSRRRIPPRILLAACALGGLGSACEDPVRIIERAPATSTLSAREGQPGQPAAGGAKPGSSEADTVRGATPTEPSPRPSLPSSDVSDATLAEGGRPSTPPRLIAIGDLHGDLAATRAALRLGGAIDPSDRWVGGDLIVVQTGDQLDRGDDERQIVDLFSRLIREAKATGGRVIALNGNHETMNAQGDFRYVTPLGFQAFDCVKPSSPLAAQVAAEYQSRAAAFLPGGAYALELAERDVIAVVNDSVFVHGGVLPEHVSYGIDRINSETRAWLRGTERAAPQSIAAERAPVWVRDYSFDPVSAESCASLGQVLDALRVKRMVVGHTVQAGGITSACGDRVYRIDVGLSRYYGRAPISVLEINAGVVRPLSAPRE